MKVDPASSPGDDPSGDGYAGGGEEEPPFDKLKTNAERGDRPTPGPSREREGGAPLRLADAAPAPHPNLKPPTYPFAP